MTHSDAQPTPTDLYLDLLARVLIRASDRTELHPLHAHIERPPVRGALSLLSRLLGRRNLYLHRLHHVDAELRAAGKDWPASAETMVGFARLANVRQCIEAALREGIHGDLVETGVWRGGTVIYMRAVLKAHGDRTRRVWAADSFRGLPPPSPKFPQDTGDIHHTLSHLAVSRAEVEDNFRRYGLLDDQVCFLEGWFEHTLPSAPINAISVLRLDGDMYGSTWEALTHLYPKVSSGGWVIIDDYGAIAGCRQAVHDYRAAHKITAPITEVDWTGVYWKVP